MEGFEPMPPAAPEAPVLAGFGSCPDGWRAAADADDERVVLCEPWPATGAAICAGDEAHFPGEPGCSLLGPACPGPGGFASDLPAGKTILYVQAEAAAGGDGSIDAPFGAVGDAIAAAADDAIVALSEGAFDSAISLSRPITVWGACVAGTVLGPSTASETLGVVRISGRGGNLENLTIASDVRVGLVVEGTSDPGTIESVVIRARGTAVAIHGGGDLTARDVAVRDMTPGRFGQGYAFEVYGGGTADLQRVSIEGALGTGVWLDQVGTSATLSDVAIRDTDAGSTDYGVGLNATLGARAVLDRVVVEGSGSAGLSAGGDGASIDATDVLVRGTLGNGAGRGGTGFDLFQGASATLAGAMFVGNRSAGLTVSEAGTSLVAENLVVVETEATAATELGGFGLDLFFGASANVTRAYMARNRTAGIQVGDGETRLVATDVVVRGTRARALDGIGGAGLVGGFGAEIDLTRTEFLDNRMTGIHLQAPSATVLRDLRVADTRVQEGDGYGGFGVLVYLGAAAELDRVLLERNVGSGLIASESGSSVSGTDVHIVETADFEGDGDSTGLRSQDAVLSLERVRVEGTVGFGVVGFGSAAKVSLADLLILDTHADCVDGSCRGGNGLSSFDGALVSVSRFRISGSELAGVQVEDALDLSDGEVSGNTIGANVQNDGFDIGRIQDRVLYRDNGRNLDSQALPTPESVDVAAFER